MIKRGVTELKEKLNTERDLKIAIIDNNLILRSVCSFSSKLSPFESTLIYIVFVIS